MKQGVLTPKRVRLLLATGASCYRPRRAGERTRKSVRGCIVAADIAALSLIVVKQGENDIPGLTDTVLPRRLGPKRATKIRRFFNLTKEDDVRKFVVRREVTSAKKPDAKPYTKAPKIQRLVTPVSNTIASRPASLCVAHTFLFAGPSSTSPSPSCLESPPNRGPKGSNCRIQDHCCQASSRAQGQDGRRQVSETCFVCLSLAVCVMLSFIKWLVIHAMAINYARYPCASIACL